MSKHYQSPDSIRNLTQTQRVEALQEILFEHKKKLPQGDFKTGQDVLKALFDEEEQRRFESECLVYDVYFVLLTQEVEVRDAGSGDCSSCDVDLWGGVTVIRVRPKTKKTSLRLHPLLVEVITGHAFISQFYPASGSSVYDATILERFLEEKGRSELQDTLEAQYLDTIHQTTCQLQGRTRVLQSRGCMETEDSQETTAIELEHKVMLHQIRLP